MRISRDILSYILFRWDSCRLWIVDAPIAIRLQRSRGDEKKKANKNPGDVDRSWKSAANGRQVKQGNFRNSGDDRSPLTNNNNKKEKKISAAACRTCNRLETETGKKKIKNCRDFSSSFFSSPGRSGEIFFRDGRRGFCRDIMLRTMQKTAEEEIRKDQENQKRWCGV